MAVLSKRMITDIGREYHRLYGVRPAHVDLSGRVANRTDRLSQFARVRRSRRYALHESVNWGEPYVFSIADSIACAIVALEDRRIVHGGLAGGEVLTARTPETVSKNVRSLVALGMPAPEAEAYVGRLPVWTPDRINEAAQFLKRTFYQYSGWKPLLMDENQLKVQQQQQIAQAIEDQKRRGVTTAYPFEKERVLLSLIKSGDRNGARQVLNETLAAMYLSSPELVVLRARAVEMIGYLTRAAVEDSPMLGHIIEQEYQWIRRLIEAPDFEELSRVLTQALDDFIEAIYLQGFNRSNDKVSRALDFVSRQYMKPISLRDVAREVGLSPFRLAHLVKRHTGRSMLQVIHQVRVQNAQRLLEATDKSCTEIAYEVGYGDQSYFTRHFRRVAGITPARYRRTRRSPSPDAE